MKHLSTIAFTLVAMLSTACGMTGSNTSKPMSGFGVNNGANTAKTLSITISKGLIIKGEFASISTASGSELAGMKCDYATKVDFESWACTTDGYDLELGKLAMAKVPKGTLIANGKSYDVKCKALTAHVTGVDGPMAEYACTASLAATKG